MCCHPALTQRSAIALTLRAVGGLTTREIANAFLVPEATMAQRISRAKQTVKTSGVGFEMPSDAERASRLHTVMHVLYLIFNEGYAASSGPELVRADLCAEAIRLGRQLLELLPGEPEVMGLLGLMLLIESRRPARTSESGDLLLLADQDRSRWNRDLIVEGQAIVRECLRINQPGPYQIQAAINAVHSDAPSAAATDWSQILQLYDRLLSWTPSPVVALNRAVAVAETAGPAAALAIVDGLPLNDYYLYHSVRADLLRRLDRRAEAERAYEDAIALTQNSAERRFLERVLESLRLEAPN
jgi:RNA polymerase sigma-70 factor (ECF subfamily)